MSFDMVGIKNKYQEMSALFIESINARNITCYYENPLLNSQDSSNLVKAYGFDNFDMFGNATPLSDLGGREKESGSSLVQATTTGVIKARVYWISDDYRYADYVHKELGLGVGQRLCKVVTYISDTPKILQASYIEIENEKSPYIKNRATLAKPPSSHGFVEGAYSTTYWKTVPSQ